MGGVVASLGDDLAPTDGVHGLAYVGTPSSPTIPVLSWMEIGLRVIISAIVVGLACVPLVPVEAHRHIPSRMLHGSLLAIVI